MKYLLLLLSTLFFYACSGKKVDKSSYEEELKGREIKKVSEADLFEMALQIGDSIAIQSQKALGGKLQFAMKNGGVEEAIKFCNLIALPVVDSLQDIYGANIRRVSTNYRNPQDKPDSLENTLLESYQYNIDKGLTIKPNIQDPHNEFLLFTKPIIIDNPLCLQCHGKIGEEITEKNAQLISKLYPQDRATGYSMQQLRGMWSIRLSRKHLIIKEF